MAQKWRAQSGKGGKGGGKGAMKDAPPQVLEYQFNELANSFFAELFHWNRPAASFKSGFDELLAARERIVSAYGIKAGGGAAANGQVNWKGEFYHEFRKVHGSVTKEDISFETVEVESEAGAKGPAMYISTVTCSAIDVQYQGEAAAGKKQAEHMAAKAAIKGQFPQAFGKLHGGGGGAKAAPQQGQKRKAVEMEAPAAEEAGSKSRLSWAAQLLIGRPMTKGDILYECEAVEGEPSQFVATVTIVGHDNTVGYQGLPAANKKNAEVAAAEAALAALADTIVPLEDERKAKKATKKQESLAAFKDKQKAKDEAEAEQ